MTLTLANRAATATLSSLPRGTSATTPVTVKSASLVPSFYYLSSFLPVTTPHRTIKTLNIPGQIGSSYQNTPINKAGVDELVHHTEVYDGYTDDFGVFKEGPPTSIRLEYLRSPEHGYAGSEHAKLMWSPFQADKDMNHFTPFYFDYLPFSSRNYFGKRSGADPGSRSSLGHYERRKTVLCDQRIATNQKPLRRVPKWLACITHMPKQKSFIGFYLYANGVYVAELLTFKQLPRLAYNRPFQSVIPTVGQSVDLSEVTYGKELHSVEMYPGHGGVLCRAAGTSATVLRGTEPNLVPILLPSKEVRLFDSSCMGVYGRVAGAMYRKNRFDGRSLNNRNIPHRPRVHQKSQTISNHPAGGGKGTDENLILPLNWRLHPHNCVKTKYWLSGYIIRGRHYQRNTTVADIKAKTYSWASRVKVYR